MAQGAIRQSFISFASDREQPKELHMLRRSYLIAAALALLVTPAFSLAQFKQGDWELTLAGTGLTPGRVDAFQFGAAGSLGLFVADQLEVGVRQSVNYTDFGPGKSLSG